MTDPQHAPPVPAKPTQTSQSTAGDSDSDVEFLPAETKKQEKPTSAECSKCDVRRRMVVEEQKRSKSALNKQAAESKAKLK